MTRNNLIEEINKLGKTLIKSKGKIICFPYTLKWKGKNFSITKDKKVLLSTKNEEKAYNFFLSCVKDKL